MNNETPETFDVVVVGGGPIGLATAYEVAKSGADVMLLEQNNFFNQAGSSGDLARMFRTMYTERYMADLAVKAMSLWDALERDAGVTLRDMSGLLNFGDKTVGDDTPEGSLVGPIENLDHHHMQYKILDVDQIEQRYPFKNLPKDYIGIFAPDNGIINVQLLLRTLSRLARDYGAKAQQYTVVNSLEPHKDGWLVKGLRNDKQNFEIPCRKVVLTCGAYVNHILENSFNFRLNLKIWEMVASYWSVNPGPSGCRFPSMWFQFAKNKGNRSQLFYGFPTLDWGPPNTVRISVDAATRQITDPKDRKTNIVDPEDISDAQEYIRDHVVGVDSTVPASTMTCLQTNVFDNMFVLDYVPEKFLRGGPKDSVAVFTSGWAMKFVPLLGRALKDMVLKGGSEYRLKEFLMTRSSPDGKERVIAEVNTQTGIREEVALPNNQAQGSSFRCQYSVQPHEIVA